LDRPKIGYAVAALVVAAALLSWRLYRGRPRDLALALAPTRAIEARLSWPGADRFRPYDDKHVVGHAREAVPIDVLAALERRGDMRGLAAGWLLAGETERAVGYLERAGASPDVDSDRAVAAQAGGQTEQALSLVDHALAVQPRHAQALWNRALILRQLGLLQSAAKAFDDVAALGEPGWQNEARARALALRAADAERVQLQARLAKQGQRMSTTGELVPLASVHALPGLMRHYLYHAVRSAPSQQRVLTLLPIAVELDRMNGETRLADYVRATAKRDLTRRAPLSASYARLVPNQQSMTPAEIDAFIAAIRRAHEDEMLLGVLWLVHRIPEHLAEYERLAQQLGDPWYIAIVDNLAGEAAWEAGDVAAAERRWREGDARCRAGHADYHCALIELSLAKLTAWQHRTSEARRIALDAIARARAQGLRHDAVDEPGLYLLGDIARCRNAFSLMRAYLEEPLLRVPSCEGQRFVREELAIERMFALDRDGALGQLAEAPRCNRPMTTSRAILVVGLARAGASPPEAATLPAELEAVRPHLKAGAQAMADVQLGRLIIDDHRDEGRARIRAALDAIARLPPSDFSAKRARADAQLTLAVDDARHGDRDAALDRLAVALAATAPRTCALGAAVDDERAFAVVRDASGRTLGRYLPRREHAEIDPAELIPADLAAALRGCPSVAVFAPAPVHGQPRLLPPDLAWAYRMGTPVAPPRANTSPRRLVISDVEPPAALQLPRLGPWRGVSADRATAWLHGAAATPARALAELTDAGEVEIHAHGLVNLDLSDASLLVLSSDARGDYALTAGAIRRHHLNGAPIVILGACQAGTTTLYVHEPWSLPAAFVDAGARAVFASPSPIRDAEAGPFFDAVLARVRRGEPPAAALRDERLPRLLREPQSWVRDVLVFE
jgi:hypothetical protein